MSSPDAFQVLCKPRGAICNLDCRYCYYLPKKDLYPSSASRMSDALLEEYTRQYIEAQPGPELTFAWQGGEPLLMGLEFFRRAVELQDKYRRPGMRIQNALQTNATLLDEAWGEFFREREFLLGVSLDGPRAVHDAYRVDKNGAPTFDRVLRGIRLLQKHQVEFNVLTTVHAANADQPLDVYRFLRDDIGTQFVQFIPIVEHERAMGLSESKQITARSVTGQQYGQFLTAIFDEWVRRDVGRVFVQLFDVALGVWLGQPASLCIFREVCGKTLVMEHNGDVYSCDHFVAAPFHLGNLNHTTLGELVTSPQQERFGTDKTSTLPRLCRECQVRFVCNGGCPKDRTLTTPDGEPGLNYLCEGFKAFFTHVDGAMNAMAELIRQGRAAEDIMLPLAREDAELEAKYARTGRNDPCPCGSGKKFKHCHLTRV